jgi:hypothetical protein
LSLAGALTTFGIAGVLLVDSPLFNGEGISGDWTNVTYGIILVPWGIILTLFARRLMVDQARHVIWGSVVVACNAVAGIFIMGIYAGQLLASSLTLSQALALIGMMSSSALGFVGGLLGVFSKRSGNTENTSTRR